MKFANLSFCLLFIVHATLSQNVDSPKNNLKGLTGDELFELIGLDQRTASLKVSLPYIIYVDVAIYPHGVYDMKKEESWARVSINGGASLNRKGYLKFDQDEITLVIGRTVTQEELFLGLSFQYSDIGMRKVGVITENYSTIFSFHMLEPNGNQINIQFDPELKLTDQSNPGSFVLSDYGRRRMFFLRPTEDVTEIMYGIYE